MKTEHLIIAVVAIVAVAYFTGVLTFDENNRLTIRPPDLSSLNILNFNFTVNIPTGGQQPPPSDNGNQPPTPPPTPNDKKPTSITISVSPNPMNMKGWAYGLAVTDGSNWPIRIHARHVGQNAETTINGLIGPDGKFEMTQQLNTPGEWEFYAEADGVRSNTVQLTVRGILLVIEIESYSKTFPPDEVLCHVYSDHTGNCPIYASNDNWASEVYITNMVIGAGGYGLVNLPGLNTLANGNWEFDARIAGETARGWGGTDWVSVGR